MQWRFESLLLKDLGESERSNAESGMWKEGSLEACDAGFKHVSRSPLARENRVGFSLISVDFANGERNGVVEEMVVTGRN